MSGFRAPWSKLRPGNLLHVLFALFLLAGALAAVRTGAGPHRAMPAVGEPASLLLINGVFYTGDSARPRVEAVAILGESIVAIGST